jgi:hypothetical protein
MLLSREPLNNREPINNNVAKNGLVELREEGLKVNILGLEDERE